jgi:phosphoglycolate phosphatase
MLTPQKTLPIEAVIFDLDGTLLDSAGQIAAALNTLFLARGLEPFSPEELAGHIGWGSRRLIETTFAARGSLLTPELLAACERVYLANYADIAANASLFFPGAIDVIRTLDAWGIALGLCTNKPEAITRSILDRFGVLSVFAVIVAGDSGFGLKPDPAPLAATRRQLRTTAPRTLFVGDSAIDNETACAAGIPFAHIRHPGQPPPRSPLEAGWRLTALGDLLEIVKHRNGDRAP